MDVAELGIRVDATGAITVLDKFGKKVDEVEGKSSKLEETLKKAAAAFGAYEIGHKFLDETIKAQDAQTRLEAAVKATGGTAGKTASELEALGKHIQNTTVFSHDAAESAEAMLVGFNNISGKNFQRVTEDAADLATFLKTDLTSAAEMVGRALQDPANATTMLQRTLRLFSQDQIKTIKLLAETGNTAAAQNIILAALEVRYKGVAAAARDTLGGSLANLKNSFNDLFQVSKGGTSGLVVIINALAEALEKVKPHMGQLIALVGAGVTAWLAYRAVLLSVIAYNAIITAAQTIRAFIQLAVTIRSVADAMALLSMVGGGVVKIVAMIAAMTLGFVAYKALIKQVNEENKRFVDGLPSPNAIGPGTEDKARTSDMAEELRKMLADGGTQLEIAEAQLKNFGQQATAIDKLKNAQEAYNIQKEAEVRLNKGEITGAEYEAIFRTSRRSQDLKDMAVDIAHTADQVKQVWSEAVDGIHSSFTDFFSSMFTDGVKSATNLVNAIKQLFFHMIGELLAQQLMKKLLSFVAGDQNKSVGVQQTAAAAVMLNAANIQAAAAATMAEAAGTSVASPAGPGAAGASMGMMGKAGAFGSLALAAGGIGYGMGSSIGGGKGMLAGTLSGAATGAMIGSVVPVIGTAIGAVVGGAAGFVGSMFGAGAAAKKHAAEIKQVQDAYEAFTDDLKVQLGIMTSTDQQIKQLKTQVDAQIKAQETAGGRPYNSGSVAAIAQLNALETARIKQLKDEAALIIKTTQESIEARRLRALGDDYDADALDLKIQHEKEYADAVAQGLDSVTLAQLKYVQSLEEQKAAADAFVSSALNVPEGYKVAKQLFDALDPEQPGPQIDVPTPGQLPGGTDNGGGLPFPTRGTTPTDDSQPDNTPLVINLDGKTIARTTLDILRRAAQQQTGDSTAITSVMNI